MVTHLASGRQAVVVGAAGPAGELQLSDNEIAEIGRMRAADRSAIIDGTQIFVRVYAAPIRMVVVGAVHIGQALVPMARLAGFKVTVIDPRAAFVKSSGFDGAETIEAWPDEAMKGLKVDAHTAVVTLTHDPKLDDPALA
ncbi:MAG: xanthine dehydrogenase, partial [Alphaproteobacteria bacterium]|nr:xanthine dehydrogenase [Alphaproteobacteria bacterium]